MQVIAVVGHDQAIAERDLVESADLEIHCVIGTAVAHIIDFAQERVEGFCGRAEFPTAGTDIAIGFNKELDIESNTPAADGNVGAEAQAIELLLADSDAAHAA